MKYLEFEALERLSTALSCVDIGDSRVFGRIECYSCKNTGEDKRLKQHIDHKYDANANANANANGNGHSPNGHATSSPRSTPASNTLVVPNIASSVSSASSVEESHYFDTSPELSFSSPPLSPFGPLSDPTSRKTMFYLLATLNAAFPDYDFSDIKPEYFTKIPTLSLVVNNVNTTLFNMGNDAFAKAVGERIWDGIDEAVDLNECDIWSFNADPDIEPDAEEGNLWSFYYFFFNRKLKRVVFFTCRAVSFMAPVQPEENPDLILDPLSDDEDDDLLMDLGPDYPSTSPRPNGTFKVKLEYDEYLRATDPIAQTSSTSSTGPGGAGQGFGSGAEVDTSTALGD
ncbi:RNA polymerase III-inhibiting protein maf1, partial [Quaeritorhiza haematococci]